MLRPMVATTAVTAALILVAGCGGNDKKSDAGTENKGGESTTSTTPSAPTAPSFDPPKAFSPAGAYPVIKDKENRFTEAKAQTGIAGQVALIGRWTGLTGHDVADPNKTWTVKSAEVETTKVSDATKPVAVKVDGKDVALVAYAESDKGSGTQKPSGLVVVHWVDVESGQKIAEVSAKVSTLEGTGDTAPGTPSISAAAYDPETGQVAVGVGLAGSVSKYQTVYADPKTQKSTIVPGMNPAAVHGGVVAGSKGAADKGADGTVLLVDGASGKVTKQVPLQQASLQPLATSAGHAYFYGYKDASYVSGTKGQAIFVVDLSTGAVTQTVPAPPSDSNAEVECLADQATSVVCTSKTVQGSALEIVGFDDATGKKAWGYTSDSGGRVVPRVTAAFHGVVYAQTEAQPVLMDAKTGADLPSASSSSSPGSSETPSSGDTPTSGDTPSGSDSPTGNESPGNGDMGLFDGKVLSPSAVSPYGGVYGQLPSGDGMSSVELESVFIFLKPTA
ncbi:hypothetical protein EV649_7216 [Kribbella sp. VKM Ac-2569]|uniref:hypothetical protein n=1 Tax=Kribbella sp. VKM Ac-2569 TaxID=2512220 RepID=UPI00102ADE53|nr:hypothetical protein [Kribbella sp. VKM Ac-2569]RZT12847.1 hypothetical protein EV649_7216 [Kribbella sp. VKM Ac-2569]